MTRARPSWTIETHQAPGPVEQEPPGQAPGAGGDRRVGVVEQPLVGPERPVEPHAVVEAGAHEVGVVPAHRVGLEDGVEQRHVRGVGGHAGVQQRVVGQLAVGPDPQPLVGLAGPVRAARAGRRCSAGRWGGAGRTTRPAPPARGRAARAGWPASRGRAPRAWRTGAPGPPRRRGRTPAMLKMARPCWMATTRRVVNDLPSRIRSTS